MKTWMFALMGVTPSLVAWNYALAGPPGQCGEKVIVQKAADPAQTGDGQNFVWVTADGAQIEGDVEAEVIVVGDASAAGDGRSDQKTKTIKVITKSGADDPNAAQRGWLGVAIEPVPQSMAAQLGVEGKGVLIGNVVTDSPADKAGVQAHDIIVSINSEEVAADVGPAVDLIKSRKPGESVNLGILRGGNPQTIKVTLGSRADMKDFNWKMEIPNAQLDEEIKTRGKFIMKTPEGQMIVKDLGDLENLKNLPDNIKMFVPQAGSRSTQVFVENGKKSIKTHIDIDQDGSTLNIEQDDDGPITVRRTDASGKETVATYEDEDALKAGDEQAYEIYSSTGDAVFVHVDGGNLPHVFLQGDDDSGQWRLHLEQSLAEAKEAYHEAMEELHENLMELKNEGKLDINKFHDLFSQGGQGFGPGFAFQTGKPSHRFEVGSDGSIEVSIRKGDSEMVQKFRSESEMANRRPDLYEKYQAVKAADQE